jgi:tRNA/tmRNA/rRNA uracil-C5-methylase (TrmA/RlmC/RlmD family)
VGAAWERLVRLAEETGATLHEPVVGSAVGHRHRARLMVRGRPASPKVGIFQAGTHRIVDTPRCAVHHPRINEVAAILKRAMRATGSEPYVDRPHRGRVRAVQVVVERKSEQVQVVLVTRDDNSAAAEPLLDVFEGELAAMGRHSLWWNGQPDRSNVILGPHWQHRVGPDAVRESIGGAEVFFPPAAFGQANLPLADRLVSEVHEWVGDAERVVEWYAGCGAIGLGLLASGRRVDFNEQSPASLEGLRRGVDALGPAAAARAAIFPGSAGDFARLAPGGSTGIVDPPRRGLDPGLCAALAEEPPARLIYVSCGLESFERDVERLLAPGHLRLSRLRPYALFPYTHHIETVGLLEREGPSTAA